VKGRKIPLALIAVGLVGVLALVGVSGRMVLFGHGRPAFDYSKGSMKGYELYSWQEGGAWRYSVLEGTNRWKTLDEIRSPSVTLHSATALQDVLEQIPAGQFVTWVLRDDLTLPPSAIVERVRQVCEIRGLEFYVPN
jgi:hypothetical protein